MKLTYEQKILIAQDAINEGVSFTLRKWALSKSYVKKIRTLYLKAPEMLREQERNKEYSLDFKLNVIKELVKGEISGEELAIKLNVRSSSIFSNWYHIYKTKGPEGLRDMKTPGRPKKDATKPTKQKYNFSKLVDLENPTPEQVKAMQQELKRQMCMEEVSKKFEALAQELIRKKNGL